MSKKLLRCPDFITKRKDGLTFQLFSYLTVILVSILILQGVAERALMKALLKVPESVKSEMLDLAYQANVLIEEGTWMNSRTGAMLSSIICSSSTKTIARSRIVTCTRILNLSSNT